jgi:predicted nucleotide-binding protein
MTRVLLVEDDKEYACRCLEALYRSSYEVDHAADVESAYQLIATHDYDLAILDLMLPPTYTDEGLRLQGWLRSKRTKTPIIFMTVRKEDVLKIVAAAMRNNGAKDFINKNDTDSIQQISIRAQEILMQERAKIFISHGHNELLKLKLKDFIENRLNIRTTVLADQPSQGLTIVEKLEKSAKQCSFAAILLTKDDELKNDTVRARQNVIHELGFFQGKYGRKNVVLLAERGVELFTNISGIVRIEFEPGHFESIFDPLRLEIEGSSLFASP